MLIDIGANLTSKRFRKDRKQVIENAFNAGVDKIIVTGTDVEVSQQALALSENYPGQLFCTAGVHPHHADQWDDVAEQQIKHLLQQPSVVAGGECGLDFNRNFSSPAQQHACFEAQLLLACRHQKPLFLHQRDAHAEMLEYLNHFRNKISRVVVHCFTGTETEMRQYLDLDCHIGITGWICDPRRGAHMRAFLPKLPLDRLLLETDAPYLLPKDLPTKARDGRNEPAYLPHILTALSMILQVDQNRLAHATYTNSLAFFQLNNQQ